MLRATFSKKYRIFAFFFFFCLVILGGVTIPVYAASGVPEEVMEATNSVVFITLASDAEEQYSNDELAYIKESYPEDVFRNGNTDYVINSSGSGFVIKNESGETLIATNNHVVEDDHEGIFVWVTDKKTAHAEVVFSIPEKDLSVIRINESINKKPVKMAAVDANRGEAVYVVGFPGAGNVLSDSVARTSDEATITDGIISAVRSSFTVVDGGDSAKIFQISAAINHGNSGGPLFNTEGEVIGVNTYSVEGGGTQGVFGAVAISELHALLEKYGIEISEGPSIQAVTQPVEMEVPEEKNQNKVLIIVVCVVLGMACLGILATVIRKKTLPADKLIVEPTDEVESSVEPATMTDENDEMPNVDIGITKRRVQPDDHIDIGMVSMTGKGRGKKEINKSFFNQPDKLDK